MVWILSVSDSGDVDFTYSYAISAGFPIRNNPAKMAEIGEAMGV